MSSLNVLFLEDDPSSIRLFVRKMQSAPEEIVVRSARNKETFVRELELNQFDCIVVDYAIPDMDGIEALRLVKEMSPGTPVIIYAGTVGEEKAVECMKEGAAEFLLKTNSLRLVPAILSAITQKREHEARMHAEEAQKQTEARFQALAETSSAAIFISQGEQLSYVNSVSEHLTGYSNEELLNMKIVDLIHPDHRAMVQQRGLARQRGEDVLTRYEFKIVRKDGKERWLDFAANATYYEGAPAALGIAFDVTDRKKAEEDLLASELRYRTLFEANPHPMWVYDIDTLQFLTVNDAAIHHYGYSREEFLSMTIKEIRPPEDLPGLMNHLQRRVGRTGFDEAGIWRHQKKSGEMIEVEIVSHTLEFDGRNAKMILALDVTERKKAEEIIRESEEKYRSVFENVRDIIFALSPEGIITALNPVFESTTGWRCDEWIGKPISDIVHPEDYPIATQRIQEVLRGGQSIQREIRFRKKSGEYLISEVITTRQIRNGKVIGLLGTARDITNQKRLEQQVRNAQKMESIGTLAGGIAHDFNNILNIVSGYATMAERHKDKPDKLVHDIEMIRNASERGASFTRQLLTFARKSEVKIEPANVNSIITELIQMLNETFPKTIEIESVLDTTIQFIEGDQNQLNQALLNLAVNSRDAMPEGGKLRFMTNRISGDRLRQLVPDAIGNEYIHIEVSDTGQGMDEETKSKVFDPFFTTKQKGKGTGLGLAVVYGIIGSHNGFVEVDSELNRGTTMHLYLPLSFLNQSMVQPSIGIGEIRGGSESILIVEDEHSLRQYLKSVLEEKGYHILEASDGIEAIELYRTRHQQIALVISDFGMPKLNGYHFLQQITEICPTAKVILASGYIDAEQRSEILKAGARDILQKPYNGREVLLRVREVLDVT